MKLFSSPRILDLVLVAMAAVAFFYFKQVLSAPPTGMLDGPTNPLLEETGLADRANRTQFDEYKVTLSASPPQVWTAADEAASEKRQARIRLGPHNLCDLFKEDVTTGCKANVD